MEPAGLKHLVFYANADIRPTFWTCQNETIEGDSECHHQERHREGGSAVADQAEDKAADPAGSRGESTCHGIRHRPSLPQSCAER